MNKTQLVDAIAKKASITKVDAKKALDAFINVTDKIALIGFGSFAVAKKPGRTDVTRAQAPRSKSPQRTS